MRVCRRRVKQPPGFEDIDPSAIEEMMGMMSGAGGMPDPAKLRKLLKSNPALQKMMEQFAPGMGGGGFGDMGGGGGGGPLPGMGGKGGGRSAAQARLQEKLLAKRDAGDVNIPEVKASGKAGQALAATAAPANDEDDDWGTSKPFHFVMDHIFT
jgi:hypothetical protein